MAGVAALTAVLYLLSNQTFPADSDGATVVLEGQAMAAGHLTLHGWALSLDSFWSVDAVFYMVAVLLVGVRSALLHLVPAFIAVLVILVGILIAREGRRGAAAVAAAVTVVALLGFPSHYLAYFLLRGPLHVGTTLVVSGRVLPAPARPLRHRRGWWPWSSLAAGLTGDLQMVGIGLAPVCRRGLTATMRTRSWKAGAPLAGAAVASVVVAGVIRRAAELLGTFAIGKVQPSATASEMLVNLRNVLPGGLHMLGVGAASAGCRRCSKSAHRRRVARRGGARLLRRRTPLGVAKGTEP